jgi:hypothetical protein
MSIKGKSVLLAVSALGLVLAGAGPALAQGHSGGGGHAGGHSVGGGGHAAVGHAGGGAHFAGPGHFAGGGRVATAYHGGSYAHGAGFAGHAGYVGGHGYSTGWRGGYGGWRGSAWRGGYWHGGFWPGAFYGAGFAWFLPILPLAYATYWYGGIPYYYANDVYYTWNPTYDGYVATDPPPVADSSGSADVGGAPQPSDAGATQQNAGAPQQYAGPGPGGPVPGQIFMYPKNGQSAEQQAADRAECQKWATDQAGQVAQNGSDYNRAMVACVEGRGYSAR